MMTLQWSAAKTTPSLRIMSWFVGLWTLWMAVVPCSAMENPVIKGGSYCEFHTFNARCGEGEVIELVGAQYGRMHLGECVNADLGYVGCSKDVLDIVDNRCSGKRSCDIFIPDEKIATRKPCLTELKMYLEANYTCRKVIGVEQTCRDCDFVKVTQASGTIASVTSRETGCGSINCPWRIEAPPGQRINISLINYGWSRDRDYDPANCQAYATVREVNTAFTDNICAKNQRLAHAYTSKSHAIELRVIGWNRRRDHQADDTTDFLFRYNFFGCATLPAPSGGWVKRVDDVITMGCNNSHDRWTLQCRDHEWQGEGQTCPGYGHGAIDQPVIIGNFSIPSGLSVVIIIAVAFVVGALILCIGVIMFRRRYVRQQLEQAHMYTEAKIESQEVPKDSLYMPPLYCQDPNDVTKMYHVPGTPKQQQRQPPQQKRDNYTPIWERPLPNPSGTDSSVPCTCSTGNTHGGGTAHAPQVSDYESEYNTLGESEPSSAHVQSQTRKMVYGNNTMARKECEKLTPDSDIDPRYFQLDPETMSSGEL